MKTLFLIIYAGTGLIHAKPVDPDMADCVRRADSSQMIIAKVIRSGLAANGRTVTAEQRLALTKWRVVCEWHDHVPKLTEGE